MFEFGNLTYEKTVTVVTEACCNCGVLFGIDKKFQEALKRDGSTFYCPNGHGQCYSDTKEQRLERQLKQKENELAQVSSAKIQLEFQLDAANKKLSDVHGGKCPCCDKTYKHLKRHMEKNHPQVFKK